MQGIIIRVETAGGLIRSTDGQRYRFGREDWGDAATPPRVGQSVDFEPAGEIARDIVVVGQAKASSESTTNGTLMGVISIVAAVLGLVPGVGLVLVVIALVTGIIGRRQAKAHNNASGKTLATIGVVISCMVLAVDLIFSIGLIAVLSGAMTGGPY